MQSTYVNLLLRRRPDLYHDPRYTRSSLFIYPRLGVIGPMHAPGGLAGSV